MNLLNLTYSSVEDPSKSMHSNFQRGTLNTNSQKLSLTNSHQTSNRYRYIYLAMNCLLAIISQVSWLSYQSVSWAITSVYSISLLEANLVPLISLLIVASTSIPSIRFLQKYTLRNQVSPLEIIPIDNLFVNFDSHWDDLETANITLVLPFFDWTISKLLRLYFPPQCLI